MLIKNLRIYNNTQYQPDLRHLYIDNAGKITYFSDDELSIAILMKHIPEDEKAYDANSLHAAMPGMLDAHVHGQGGFDFGDTTCPENVMGAVEALGKTGLAYVMATIPTLNPGWCEFRVLSELPPIVKGASVEAGNRNQALYRMLPGPAKASYAIVNDELFYIDKLAESIEKISMSKNQLDLLRQKLHLDTLQPELMKDMVDIDQDNITYKAFSRPNAPFDRLSSRQLKMIEEIAQHQHVMGALPAALKAMDVHVAKEKIHRTPGLANIVGVHLEGPFIAHNCKGAHDERALQDEINYEMLMDIISAAPNVTQWKLTFAPNLAGAINFLDDLNHHRQEWEEKGISIKVNIGHSNASKKQISEAIERGAVGFTHLGNACKESCCRKTKVDLNHDMTARDATSNVVQWVLDPDNNNKVPHGVELITDRFHLSADFVKLVSDTIGADKVMVITDALGASGLDDGRYRLGTLPIIKKGEVFYLADDPQSPGPCSPYTTHPPTLAGGASSLAACVRNYAQMALSDEHFPEKMDLIFQSSVVNPRQTSLDNNTISNLSDDKNMVIVNQEGEIVLSVCNGKIMVDKMTKLKKKIGQTGKGLWADAPTTLSCAQGASKSTIVLT